MCRHYSSSTDETKSWKQSHDCYLWMMSHDCYPWMMSHDCYLWMMSHDCYLWMMSHDCYPWMMSHDCYLWMMSHDCYSWMMTHLKETHDNIVNQTVKHFFCSLSIICLRVYLPICLLACLPTCLSIRSFVYLFACLNVRPLECYRNKHLVSDLKCQLAIEHLSRAFLNKISIDLVRGLR